MPTENNSIRIGVDGGNLHLSSERLGQIALVDEGLYRQLPPPQPLHHFPRPDVGGADDGVSLHFPRRGLHARHATGVFEKARDLAALTDLHAQLQALAGQRRDILVRFAVASQGIVEPSDLA